MSLYNATEIMDILSDMISSGTYQVDISKNNSSLTISNYESCYTVQADTPKDEISIDTTSSFIAFSPVEVSLILHSVSNALEYYKEALDGSEYSKEDKRKIKSTSVETRNLEAKLIQIIKKFENL